MKLRWPRWLKTAPRAQSFDHAALGRFTPVPRYKDCFEGHMQWGERRIKVLLVCFGGAPIDVADGLQLLAGKTAELNALTRDARIKELYPLWREHWQRDQPLIDEQEWLSRQSLRSITFKEGGWFALDFDDGGLFDGHEIEVEFDADHYPFATSVED